MVKVETQFLVIFVCCAQVHDGQHHEQEGLQGDNQNVEDRPAQLQHATEQRHDHTGIEHQSNKNEDHFARVHVSKQSQSQ